MFNQRKAKLTACIGVGDSSSLASAKSLYRCTLNGRSIVDYDFSRQNDVGPRKFWIGTPHLRNSGSALRKG